jgi:hypothetical protein
MSQVKAPHENPPILVSRNDQLRQADDLFAKAQLYQSGYMNKPVTKRQEKILLMKTHWTFSEAIALYEYAGDFADSAFKERLAQAYELCSYTAGRLAHLNREVDQISLGTETTAKDDLTLEYGCRLICSWLK